MSDDLKNRGAQDRSRISLTEPHEVRYWTEALHTSVEEITRVVAEVGPSAAPVRGALKQ